MGICSTVTSTARFGVSAWFWLWQRSFFATYSQYLAFFLMTLAIMRNWYAAKRNFWPFSVRYSCCCRLEWFWFSDCSVRRANRFLSLLESNCCFGMSCQLILRGNLEKFYWFFFYLQKAIWSGVFIYLYFNQRRKKYEFGNSCLYFKQGRYNCTYCKCLLLLKAGLAIDMQLVVHLFLTVSWIIECASIIRIIESTLRAAFYNLLDKFFSLKMF